MMMNSVFSGLEVSFTLVHPLLNTTKIHSEFIKTGIKVLMVKCYIYVGFISILMVGDIGTGNNVTGERGSVKGKKGGDLGQNTGVHHRGVRRFLKSHLLS